MKTILSTAIITVAFTCIGYYGTTVVTLPVQANEGLVIDWGVPPGEPIFTVDDTKPGDVEPRIVTVTNNDDEGRTVSIKGLLSEKNGQLNKCLEVIIAENGVDLYGGVANTRTLNQFFEDSQSLAGIPLSTLASGESTEYVITIIFDQSEGNRCQGDEIEFDISIGVVIDDIDVPEECSDIFIDGEVIYGTSGNDRLRGTGKNDLIVGLEGNDRIDGGNGDDCLIGNEGNDRIRGGDNNDVLVGGEGGNWLKGGDDKDLLIGGDDPDDIRGGDNNDVIYGYGGNDELDGGGNDDIIYGGDGDDGIDAGQGDDLVFGELGHDEIEAGSGDDEVYGGRDDDEIDGGSGNDALYGEEGEDTIDGGAGEDMCEGEDLDSCES